MLNIFFFSSVFINEKDGFDCVKANIKNVSPKEPLWVIENQVQKRPNKLHVNKPPGPDRLHQRDLRL